MNLPIIEDSLGNIPVRISIDSKAVLSVVILDEAEVLFSSHRSP